MWDNDKAPTVLLCSSPTHCLCTHPRSRPPLTHCLQWANATIVWKEKFALFCATIFKNIDQKLRVVTCCSLYEWTFTSILCSLKPKNFKEKLLFWCLQMRQKQTANTNRSERQTEEKRGNQSGVSGVNRRESGGCEWIRTEKSLWLIGCSAVILLPCCVFPDTAGSDAGHKPRHKGLYTELHALAGK